MIHGAHVIIYSKDSEADRAFLRDGKLGVYRPKHPSPLNPQRAMTSPGAAEWR